MSKFLKNLALLSVAGNLTSNLLSFARAEDEDDLDKEDSADDKAAEKPAESKVVTITDKNLKSVLEDADKQGKALFIKFYAPWCGHCKRMMPDWEDLANTMSTETNACIVAKLDATAEDARESGQDFGIRGFPTLKMIKGDRMWEYEGRRDAESMKEFCLGAFQSLSSDALPWKASFVDKAKKVVGEYLEKAGQVQAYEPTLLPIIFLFGAGVGSLLGMAVILMTGVGQQSAAPAKKEKTEKKEEVKKDK